TAVRRRLTGRTSTCRARARAAGRRTCGSPTGARCSTLSASSGPCCGSERATAPASSAPPGALDWISPCSISRATKHASSTAPSSRSSAPTRSSPGAAATTAPPKACSRGLPAVAEHHHDHHEDHHHHHRAGSHAPALHGAALLTVGFALVEAVGGWWTGSLALLSDAGHMLTDGAALGLAALAAWMARRPPSARHSYGLGRAEVLAALVNAVTMLVIAAAIAYEALARWQSPPPIKGGAAALIAAVGLAMNLVILRRLTPHSHDLNTRAAMLHVVGDAMGSAAALAAGLVIALSGWLLIDAIASLAIALLIAASALRLTRESLHALMEGVPHGVSVDAIGLEMARVEGVISVHDLHVWTLSGSRTALSAHVVVGGMREWDRTLAALQRCLHDKYGIDHVTLQPESDTRPLVRY